MAWMLAYLKVPLSWGEILRRTFTEAFFKDNCLGMAAQLAVGDDGEHRNPQHRL